MRFDANECFDSGRRVEQAEGMDGSMERVLEVGMLEVWVAMRLGCASPASGRGSMAHAAFA